jgi:hypothetical protein
MNNSKTEEKIIIDGVELKAGIFLGNEYLSEEDAEKIAKRCPVLVEIVRRCNNKGRFQRTINIHTLIHYKKNGKTETTSQITDDLLDLPPYSPVSVISKEFESLEEAEKWTSEMIDHIKRNREKIMRNKKTEKRSEIIIIV